MSQAGPNPTTVGPLVAEHLGPILYALETCALTMTQAGRTEEATYFRRLAEMLAEAGGQPRPAGED